LGRELWRDFINGIISENAVLRLMIGLCPTLAVSNNAINAFGMGIAATFVLVCSNVVVSAIRKWTPHEIRIPIFITVISTFVTITDYFMQAYSPPLHKALGVFVPLIVVNCIILGRAEAFFDGWGGDGCWFYFNNYSYWYYSRVFRQWQCFWFSHL
jgi:electron transport complex protein RnfE